jgi:hypothetical protein
VALLGLVLNVRDVDGNTALLLLRGVVDLVERRSGVKGWVLVVKYLGDCRSQSGLTVVNVTNGTDVNVRLGALEFRLSHLGPPQDWFSSDKNMPEEIVGFVLF